MSSSKMDLSTVIGHETLVEAIRHLCDRIVSLEEQVKSQQSIIRTLRRITRERQYRNEQLDTFAEFTKMAPGE